jgi:hypothetical protein
MRPDGPGAVVRTLHRHHAAAGLAPAREIGEPQYFISPLGLEAHLEVIHGRTDEATELIHELLDRLSDG